jgi:hypothetical protein
MGVVIATMVALLCLGHNWRRRFIAISTFAFVAWLFDDYDWWLFTIWAW